MIRLLIFFIVLVMLPFIFIIGSILIIVMMILIKFNIIKFPLKMTAQMGDIMRQKKPFSESTMNQLSCKHHNLEQKQDILLCSDCGKIIEHI